MLVKRLIKLVIVLTILSAMMTIPGVAEITLAEALDNYALTYTSWGHADWYGENTIYYFGGDAARSGSIINNQESLMQTTVIGPGIVRFFWSVSSEANYDYLEFYIDGALQNRVSGSVPWQLQSYYISSSGIHYLMWRYSKDVSGTAGDDAGWVDKLEFSEPSITVLSPNGGENWERGYTQTIRWLPSGIPGDHVSIGLLKGNEIQYFISLDTPDVGSYSWTISPYQEIGTDYKVKITSKSNAAITDTSDNSFNIGVTPASISIVTPNGGENWLRGTTHTITWDVWGSSCSDVKIELLKGGIFNSVISSGTPNDGLFLWTTPSTQTLGGDYKVRIICTVGSMAPDDSDNPFTISSSPFVTIVSPNGGENWIKGTIHTIKWTASWPEIAFVKIELLKAGTLNNIISSSTPNDGSFSWTIPSTQVLGNDYKIRITSTNNAAYADISDNNFIINSGSPITVTYPNGGEKFVRGTTKALRWSYSGNPGSYVKIDLLKGGILNRIITYSTPIGSSGSGNYNWVIPSTQTLGSDYKIRVTSKSNSAYTDISNNNFIINNPYITEISPNGGESWGRGTTHTISWTSAGSTGSYVKIELFKSGALNRVIASSTPNDGSFSWTIPSTQTLGSDYKIKITSTSNSAYYDWSNNYFRIY